MPFRFNHLLLLLVALLLMDLHPARAQYVTPESGSYYEDEVKNILINNNPDKYPKIIVMFSSTGADGNTHIEEAVYTFEGNNIIKCFYVGTDEAPNSGFIYIKDSAIVFSRSDYSRRDSMLNTPVNIHLDSGDYKLYYTYPNAANTNKATIYYRVKYDTLGRTSEEMENDPSSHYLDKYVYRNDTVTTDSNFSFNGSAPTLNDVSTTYSLYPGKYSTVDSIVDKAKDTIQDSTGSSGNSITVKRYLYSKHGKLLKASCDIYNSTTDKPLNYSLSVGYKKAEAKKS